MILGAPLYRLLLRWQLIRPAFGKPGWRIAVIAGFAGLPLVLLTIGGLFAVDGLENHSDGIDFEPEAGARCPLY